MYPAPLLNRSFNYLPLPHQPWKNLIQTNGILRNPNELSQAKIGEQRIPLLSKDNSLTKNVSNVATKIERTSRKRPVNSFTTRFGNQDRLLSRESSLETIPTKRAIPLINSRSLGVPQDQIQRERRAHTMAPLTRISGPSSTPQAQMFATITAPIDNFLNKPHHLTQDFSKISYGKSDIEMTDDDAPIIIKVRYDPQADVLPTEDAIRKAIGHRVFDRKTRKEPFVVNFIGQNRQPQISNRIFLQSSRPFPFIPQPPPPFLRNGNSHLVEIPKPFINRQKTQPLQIPRLPSRTISYARTNGVYPIGFNNSKSIHRGMAAQQSSAHLNNQQFLSAKPNLGPSSGEVFRPPAVKDIPELSRENLLNMLNQIPDLQGRHFNIEYAPPSAPEGYPIPSHTDTTNNAYPEPVIIDKLPTNVIQHVKNSNNPALTAALEATIRQEQYLQSQPTVSSLNVQPSTVVHHAAQPYQQVQQSRPVSSDDSDSSTEVSSSETSSSEETDSEESERVSTTEPGNNLPFVEPIPSTSYSQHQRC